MKKNKKELKLTDLNRVKENARLEAQYDTIISMLQDITARIQKLEDKRLMVTVGDGGHGIPNTTPSIPIPVPTPHNPLHPEYPIITCGPEIVPLNMSKDPRDNMIPCSENFVVLGDN